MIPRKKGCGGKPTQNSPEREIEANWTESEGEEVGGSMGDNHDGFMLQILKYLVKGHDEASKRQE